MEHPSHIDTSALPLNVQLLVWLSSITSVVLAWIDWEIVFNGYGVIAGVLGKTFSLVAAYYAMRASGAFKRKKNG